LEERERERERERMDRKIDKGKGELGSRERGSSD
jgi:hypothetical protein